MRSGVIGALVLCACSSWVGLNKTELSHDTDGDGVLDIEDNCPNTANVDQLDADEDERGDACDPCPTFAPGPDSDLDGVEDGCDICSKGPDDEDEDADGIPDGCDLCPSVADPTQVDTDGDTLGDACDPMGGSVESRRYFDGFNRSPNYSWHPHHASLEWPSSGGAIHGAPVSGVTTTELYAVRVFGYGPKSWMVVTSFEAPPTDHHAGVQLFDDTFGYWGCHVRHTGVGWELVASIVGSSSDEISSAMPAPSGPVRLAITIDMSANSWAPMVVCQANDAVVMASDPSFSNSPRGVRLESTTSTAFYFLDVLQASLPHDM